MRLSTAVQSDQVAGVIGSEVESAAVVVAGLELDGPPFGLSPDAPITHLGLQ